MMRTLGRAVRGGAGSVGTGLAVMAPADPPPLPLLIASRGTTITNALALTNPTAIAVGSVLVLAGYNGAGTAMSALADSRGNPWTIVQQRSHPASGRRLYLAVARVDTAYQAGDSITWAGPGSTRIFEVWELGAIKNAGAYVNGSASAASATNALTVDSGNVTTTVDRTLLVGAVGWTFGSTGAPESTPGFTAGAIRVNGNERVMLGWRNSAAVLTESFFVDHAAANVANAVAGVVAIEALS